MRKMIWRAVSAVLLTGCYDGLSRVGDDDGVRATDAVAEEGSGDEGAASGEPERHGEGDADRPRGRQVRRLTAAQFHASLVTVTGQPWPAFKQYAGAMGQADYSEITEDMRDLTVPFDKFVHDAAMHTCRAAVAADVAGQEPPIILRWADVSQRDESQLRRNLNYLMLRFLGQQMTEDDPRVDPWMNLLTAPATRGLDDELMRERWTAVCVGLVTHPDFLTY